MQTSESIDQLAVSLVNFTEQVKNPLADQTAKVKHRNGGEHTINYPDFSAVVESNRPLLAQFDLAVVQTMLVQGDMVGAATMIIHGSGQWVLLDPFYVPAGETPQDFGGAISYSRRYSYFAALGLVASDDHGQAPQASRPKAGPGPATPAQQKKIGAEAGKAGVGDDELAAVLERRYKVETTGELTKEQASDLIDRLAAEGERRRAAAAAGADPVTGEVAAGDEPPGMDAEEYRQSRGQGPAPADGGTML